MRQTKFMREFAEQGQVRQAVQFLRSRGYTVLTKQGGDYYHSHLKNARRRYLYAQKKKLQAGGSRG